MIQGVLVEHRQTENRSIQWGTTSSTTCVSRLKKSSRLSPKSQLVLSELPDWFRDNLGDYFFDMRSEPVDGGPVRIELEVSDTCKVAYVIGNHPLHGNYNTAFAGIQIQLPLLDKVRSATARESAAGASRAAHQLQVLLR